MRSREAPFDLVAVMDREGRFVFASRSHEEVLGWTPDELVGRECFTLMHPDDVAAAAAQLAGGLGEDEPAPPVVRARAKDGSWVAVQASVHPIGDGSHSILTLEDVAAARARRVQEHTLAEVLRAAPAGIAVVDAELRFVFVNEELAAINGLPVADHPGRTIRDVLGSLADTLEPLHRRVLDTGETISGIEIEGATAARPAEQRSWRASYRPILGEGRVEGVIAVVEETTEIRGAQRESARLRRLVEQSPDFVTIGTPEGGLVYMNGAARRYAGFGEHESLSGRSFLEFMDEAERKRYATVIAPALKETGAWGQPLSITHLTTGARTELEWDTYLYDDEELGQVIAAIGRDFHDQRAAEAAARDAAHAYEELLRASPVPIVTVGLDRHVLAINPAAEEAFGWTAAEVVGGLAPWVTADERATPNVKAMWRTAESGRVVQGGMTLRRRDGTMFRVAVSGFPRVAREGTPIGATVFLFDVEEREAARERAERRERQQQAVAELGLFALEEETVEAVAGRAVELAAAELGVDLANLAALDRDGSSFTVLAAVGSEAGATVPADSSSHVGFTAAARDVVLFDDLDAETRFAGSPFMHARAVASGIAVPIAGERGAWGVLGAYSKERGRFDETDAGFLRSVANVVAASVGRGVAQAERERALVASTAKTDFLSRMSHELRTPLNAIVGFGQLLAYDELDPARREAVDQILAAGLHLVGLIDELLDVSQIEAGTVALEAVELDVAEIVRESVALVGPMAAGRSVRMVVDVPGSLAFRADPRRLRQVLINLLSNAIKYNRDEGEVLVSASRTSEGLRLAVADTGVGISTEDIARIFEPFGRIPGAARVEGTGLGLAVVSGLVEAMGGTIGVESTPGRGSVFTVALPALY